MNRNPDVRRPVQRALRDADRDVVFDHAMAERGAAFGRTGVRLPDAMHLACAVSTGVDAFCTVDDRLLKQARRVDTGRTEVLTPSEFLLKIEP